MIAKVIVDVPSRQTDRPFDYLVPSEMEQWIEVGSRVGVPFGGRVLQGFVIGLAGDTSIEQSRLKPVSELLDPVPPLLPDLIELSKWLSDKYCCSWTQALQAMIPVALKGKEERYVAIGQLEEVQQTLSGEAAAWIEKHGPYVLLDQLTARFPEDSKRIKELLKTGALSLHPTIKDKLSIKTILTACLSEAARAAGLEESLLKLPKNAGKQAAALTYIYEAEEPVSLAYLAKEQGISASAVRALADKGLIVIEETEQQRDPYAKRHFEATEPKPLTDEQQKVYSEIAAAIGDKEPQTFLLHGITGSGKTEVYLQAIQYCLERHQQAIVLVPEISLTPQMVERFKGRFGDEVAVLHSRLSSGERYDEWRKIRSRQVRVAIGARSAIFAPFEQLGLIIIDEEHESSYKQEESPKYHARDVAVYRAKQHGATVVLGSATPAMETYAAAARRTSSETGPRRSSLLEMPNRVGHRPMPQVNVVDMREELLAGNRSMFSRKLHEGLLQRLERKEQTVLLLNRRGYSTFVMCRSCGYTAGCPHCDIALTYHQKSQVMRCHYCGYAEHTPKVCPSCQSEHIRFFGTGTQKVEEELARLYPGIRVIRMDVDTTTEKNAHERLLKRFENREADVLLGTQMVAKGLDFPYVTLVGVIAADTSLHLPDFRAAERTFQLLTQVAGRAGRHHLPGEVVVQTYTPEHYAITCASQHDFNSFVQRELQHRSMLGYPPYCRLIVVTMSHDQLPLLSAASAQFVDDLRGLAAHLGVLVPLDSGLPRALEILGPVASPIAKMKDRYRFQCVLKYRGSVNAASIIEQTLAQYAERSAQKQIHYSIDVDPQVIL
ncbi:primosomal protein N' [Paenibacillus sp. GXUN7292]|uniref:primosomal protein N' n=1 Tax=Paenibacillus sp. GXUN7292 TaxID=3422499 RepID=UPI003D7DA391